MFLLRTLTFREKEKLYYQRKTIKFHVARKWDKIITHDASHIADQENVIQIFQ